MTKTKPPQKSQASTPHPLDTVAEKKRPLSDSTDLLRTLDRPVLESIAKRAHYLATQMIFQANHRSDKEKGDPKIGGHVSASASALHIMGALHLIVKTGFDHIANKPHASPTDHAYNYLLNLFLDAELQKLSPQDMDRAMMGLRAFSKGGEPVFQSYHSVFDPDHHNFFPSGTVGIPPVKAGYMALAYRYAEEQGYKVPPAHFWALTGDSEFREGSLFEAIPDLAERELGNVTWIVDYNRQSLDGHRIVNQKIMGGTDAQRIENTMRANGWDVIQIQHGHKRMEIFKRPQGQLFKNFLENELEDFQLQALLLVQDMKALKKGIMKEHPKLKPLLESLSDKDLREALHDFGGHDMFALAQAMLESKQNPRRPTLIIAHTIKGWGLRCAAQPSNHSALPNEDELVELQKAQGLEKMFEGFSEKSKEGMFCKKRGDQLYGEIKKQHQIKNENEEFFRKQFAADNVKPLTFDISLKMASYPHTQWMLGQCTAKLTRIANTSRNASELKAGQKPLPENEIPLKSVAELLVTMAPDVGTSTNLNPAMDGKIFGAPMVIDYEADLGVKDTKTPDLVPSEEISHRYFRFEIAEGNVMSCVGAFGKLRDILGIPVIPLMTVYDFFIKRALDQYFYNLYWKSNFILVGTPSGVTLSPEGAQHGWKSDFQIPNQITWEPLFCQELDWILAESMRRQIFYENEGRSGVLIRGVTRGVEQKDLLGCLRKQARYKASFNSPLCRSEYPMSSATDETQVPAIPDEDIFRTLREEVLAGCYRLIDYRGYAGYEPGDNVVHLFTMGALGPEAISASEKLLAKGIYANVYVITSPDLLIGNLGYQNNYQHLRSQLEVSGDLFVHPNEQINGHDLVTISGRRIPIVSVHDGEPGLLDNLGSIVGVKQICLAVRKHSKCGRPTDVYKYHHLDSDSIVAACGEALAETALEQVHVSQTVLRSQKVNQPTTLTTQDLWQKNQHQN